MTMTFHILKVLKVIKGHIKDVCNLGAKNIKVLDAQMRINSKEAIYVKSCTGGYTGFSIRLNQESVGLKIHKMYI